MSGPWAEIATNPTRVRPARIGAAMVMSWRCPDPIHGSLVMTRSPSRQSAAGYSARNASRVRGRVPMNEGLAMADSASARPSRSNTTTARSFDSRMVME